MAINLLYIDRDQNTAIEMLSLNRKHNLYEFPFFTSNLSGQSDRPFAQHNTNRIVLYAIESTNACWDYLLFHWDLNSTACGIRGALL